VLVKEPVPVPSEVLLLPTVGLSDVFQQIPLEVTSAPPSSVTFPPADAVVWVIPETTVVVTTGRSVFSLQEVKQINVPIKRIKITGVLIE